MSTGQSQVSEQFVGAWSLISWTATLPDGTIRHPYGEQPLGRIMYSPNGKMVACLMRRHRIRCASDNRHEATSAERDAAYRDYVSYFGAFSVDATNSTVTHHVEGATFPNWIGTDLVREFCFADQELTLSLLGPDGSAHALKWERLSE
ncbi:hypothetical protein CA54_41520 [Symmachiella macrocystis]|uniref:Lipocalin-like domain-containing protein n=1 Tax=Symmachiella macrocystis TaxID=2527985 RepID=A0A5C6B9Z9_9PLAN|nr:lipocalin-like domain-containing protein [Symmachiella macrocystis]TWU08913.1 hypothetical protein CA54_41520 [Symmachiella macrocystis]